MRVSSVIFDDGTPVEKETAHALAINEVINEQISQHVEQQWQRIKQVGAAGGLLVVAGLGLLAAGSSTIGLVTLLFGALVGGGGIVYVRSRDPDVEVTGIDKGYWTGYAIPNQNGTVIFDATESVPSQEFSLELLDDPETAVEIEQQLDSAQEYPVVMGKQGNIEESLVDSLKQIQAEVENATSHELSAPVLAEDDPVVETLSELAPEATEQPVDAGGVSISLDDAAEQVETMSEFESMVNEDHGESVLLEVSEHSQQIASDLSGLQETASELLNDHIQTAGDLFGLVSYHFYCPDCIEDGIESRLQLVSDGGPWHCGTCREKFTPGEGIPRHRIRDEIVLDIWDQLWIEKDDQRREVYESIEDQKTELQEREFEQRREEIRSTEDRIKDTRARIRDLQTEAKAKEGIVKEIGQLMVEYDRLNEQKKAEFQNDISKSFEQIDKHTNKVIKETQGVIQDRFENAEKEAKDKADMLREEKKNQQAEFLAYQSENVANGVSKAIAQTHQNKPEPRGK